ncbi:uncharacterized protein LOC117028202 [Rhinolophus ferrumequinum]|uniref:uncharacterized protein LOC117028202 n=1 Tax=Rhinolophus ferrumequinum TaxID=59479 RepID=UPI00140F9424|nr:uncharacterized protein LOC117028202 [Rhinolophus ferrumequinum]
MGGRQPQHTAHPSKAAKRNRPLLARGACPCSSLAAPVTSLCGPGQGTGTARQVTGASPRPGILLELHAASPLIIETAPWKWDTEAERAQKGHLTAMYFSEVGIGPILGPKSEQHSCEVSSEGTLPRLPSLYPTPPPPPALCQRPSSGAISIVLQSLCLSPTPGSPRRSFWLDERSFESPRNHTTCLTALGGSLYSEGSTHTATNKQCVRVSKMDVVAQSCGPTADPCYLRLTAQPLATLPTSCSSFSTHFTTVTSFHSLS